jgi:hypothetical protein
MFLGVERISVNKVGNVVDSVRLEKKGAKKCPL